MAAPTDKAAKPSRRYHPGESPGLLTRLRRDALQALASGRFHFSTGEAVHVDGGMHISRF